MSPNLIRKAGVTVSLITGLIFTAAALGLIISIIWPENDLKLFSFISNNWLVKIFKIHSGFADNKTDILVGVNLIDIGIIVLFIFVCFFLFAKLKYQNKIWFIIAISLLIPGIGLFILTGLKGRSAFMTAGIIISAILLSRKHENPIVGLTGLIANVFLLIGDLTVGTDIKIIAILFGLGYILQIIWFFMITGIFYQDEVILTRKNDCQS